ncbi:MAG: hypothetical protein IT450_11715 [Phycisphaerales bacterium]|nr:hypothetical protein [Phycisphaerales bacterium]
MEPQVAENKTFENVAATVGRALGEALPALLGAVTARGAGPQQIATTLGLDKGVASRLLKSLRSRDPFGLLQGLPGPEPLRKIVRAAEDKGAAGPVVVAAGAAIDQFDFLIRAYAGDRATFDGIIGQLLPDARGPFESRTKQLLFRGFSQLKGFRSDVEFTTFLIVPSREGPFVDYVVLFGSHGLQRLRPGAEVRLASWMMAIGGEPWRITTLDGQPLTDWQAGRLDEFCTTPPPRIRVSQSGGTNHYTLADDGFGPNAKVDLVFGQWSRNSAPLHSQPPEQRRSGVGAEIDRPTCLLQLDVLVHRSIYPGVDPELHMIDTTFRGMANINDPARKPDWVALGERIEPLGSDPARFRTAHVARYAELLGLASRVSGHELAEFRGYRLLVEYPPYGLQIGMGFARPFPPGDR